MEITTAIESLNAVRKRLEVLEPQLVRKTKELQEATAGRAHAEGQLESALTEVSMLLSSLEAKGKEILTLESQLSQEVDVVATTQSVITKLRTELHTQMVGLIQFPRSI